MSESAALRRDDLREDRVMVFGPTGNAYKAFDYTPEALEDEARLLRRALGEQTTVTYGPSPLTTDVGGTNRS